MGSRFHQLSLIESSGSGVNFRQITRMKADGEEDLHTWMVRMLAAHRCNLGLYVAEAGTTTPEDDQIDTDLWLAWDGVATFATAE
ncbi:hypothetical protein ALI22I_21870 [Saccharothrix sp. ALI-22-I]|uniref:hypothetical protein n=1 Tax=Saccharothrix sp. ALI-22-I TaxID=1933778 RepID=UPI00097C31D5|nr:hypothetical protein [Saccharothrix sp. ALI-22-I]ONI87117.1 hypothetical protein ALI22I_21870 [Saccharothrix sp. ALI-22-I]